MTPGCSSSSLGCSRSWWTARPFVTGYLALMGVLILARATRRLATVEPTGRGMPVIGFSGGMLDAIGGQNEVLRLFGDASLHTDWRGR